MSNNSNKITVNRALGKSGNLFFIPEKYVYPFMVTTLGTLIVHWLFSYIYPIDKIISVGIWLTLILTYALFYGKTPWKLGGGFHEATNWILGYKKFDPTQPQFKAKTKPVTEVGFGETKRKVKEFETELHGSCLVEICKGQNQVGAYLLEKNQKYRLVFVFGFTGIRSNLDSGIIAEIISALKDGLKDLKRAESLVFRCGKFADNQAKVNELNHLKNTCRNKRVSYLLKALKFRFNGLLKQGKFNNNPCYIECSYTLDNTAIKASGLPEQILAAIQELSSNISGKNLKEEQEDKLKVLLEKAYQEGFIFWREFLRAKLSLEAYVEPLSAYEIYERDYQKYNDSPVPPSPPQVLRLKGNKLKFEINSPYHLTTNIFQVASPDADKQWVYLPGKEQYVGGVVYLEKPGEWKGLKTQLEAGSSYLNNSSTVDTEIVIELSKPNQEALKYQTQKRTRSSNSSLNNSQKRNVINVGASYNIEQNIELEKAFLAGEVGINVGCVYLVYRRSPSALRLAINRFKDLFRQPAVVKRETEYFDEMWLTTLPFRWSNILYKYNRQLQYRTEETVCLLPLNFESTIATKGLCLISDKGVPLHLDFYTKKPETMAILGKKGSGKSVVMQGGVTLALGYGLDVTIIDKTRGDGTGTFDAITNFVGGSYFNTISESNNLFENVNPKEISNKEKREAAEEIFKRFLKTGLISLLVDKDQSAEKKSNYKFVLTSALEKFFKDYSIQRRYEAAHRVGIGSGIWQDIPTMKNFLVFLGEDYIDPDASDAIVQAYRDIRYRLKIIISSPVGRMIATPSTFDNSNKLVVYAIGDVDEEAMTPIALSAFSAAIRKSLRSTRSLLCMDECSNLGSNYEIYGETLRGFCSRGRKEGVSVIYAGQDLESIKSMGSSAQILDNTDHSLIGKSTSSALGLLEKELEIPREIARKNTLDNFSNKNDNSTPWLLKSGSTLSFCHYYPSLQELALIKNEPDFVEIRDKYFSKYENPYEAISHLVKMIENN